MKSKKIITGMLLIAILVASISGIVFNNFVYAESETERSFAVSIVSVNPNKRIEPGTEFEVNVNVNNFRNIGKGIISLTGQLEYDKNILERISITGKNGWKLGAEDINERNLKFVTDNGAYVKNDGEMFTIKFKAKETIKEEKQTSVKVKGITASGGEGIIRTSDAQLGVSIQMPEEPPVVEERITSEVYVINNTDKDISRIAPGTTVAQFKTNVTTEQEMVFLDKDGHTLEENSILATGMTIKVGKTLQYKLIVTGDIDGDGRVGIEDLAKVKLHLIDYEKLTGTILKAADVDNDGEITINDAAQIKLVIINLFEIK